MSSLRIQDSFSAFTGGCIGRDSGAGGGGTRGRCPDGGPGGGGLGAGGRDDDDGGGGAFCWGALATLFEEELVTAGLLFPAVFAFWLT